MYGRVSGASAARYLLTNVLENPSVGAKPSAPLRIDVDPTTGKLSLEVTFGTATAGPVSVGGAKPAATASTKPAAPAAKPQLKEYTYEEVAKHNTEADCWVVVAGQVLDVTKFLKDHPGGKKAILIYAGKDATEEFNMLHKPDVIQKYAAYTIIGKVKEGSKPKHSKL